MVDEAIETRYKAVHSYNWSIHYEWSIELGFYPDYRKPNFPVGTLKIRFCSKLPMICNFIVLRSIGRFKNRLPLQQYDIQFLEFCDT